MEMKKLAMIVAMLLALMGAVVYGSHGYPMLSIGMVILFALSYFNLAISDK